jgi:hypothetical protein
MDASPESDSSGVLIGLYNNSVHYSVVSIRGAG